MLAATGLPDAARRLLLRADTDRFLGKLNRLPIKLDDAAGEAATLDQKLRDAAIQESIAVLEAS